MRHSFFLAGAAYGLKPNDNFAVLSCNNQVTKEPELIISIKQTYFNDNLSWLLDQARFKIIPCHFTVTSPDCPRTQNARTASNSM